MTIIFKTSSIPFLLGALSALLVLAPTSAIAATIQWPAANREPPCTGSFDWVSPKMAPADCLKAIEKLWLLEVAYHGDRKFEFMGWHSGTRKTPLEPMKTPRRYTVGKTKYLTS